MNTAQKSVSIILLTTALVLNPQVILAKQDTNPGSTQGNSHSNPDGGGVDKPYPADNQPAKSQGSSDFDGNNGCGNDADHEDDNNGKCKGLKKHDIVYV